ncbi:hypothetical protein CAEBREN_23530 [Caenorhabditis brenneri]|uniref:Uncharacterized protein n=1 Tax=Caenorhabditis brenneri TaxID=135651 RepID=G0MU00_CAEBE|nr:hypothetical protein CAEBREN_23530 [Caenorhabditis brenneri]
MCTKNTKRTSLRIKRVEAEKTRKERGETRARAVRAIKPEEKRNSDSSKINNKENTPTVQANKTTPPIKLADRKSTCRSKVNVATPQAQDSSSSNPSASSEKTTPPMKCTVRRSNAKVDTPQAETSSNSSAPKRLLGPTDESEAGPSEAKRAAPTPSSQNEEVREKKPYTKYDVIPEEYLEPNWWTQPAVKTTADSPILFKAPVESIVMGENWEEDRVEFSEPPSRPKAVIPKLEQIPSSNELTQLMHALQHFVHTLNKSDTDVFEKLVDEMDNVVDVMQSENKAKSLNLYAIQFDTHMYQVFSCMKPKQLCQGEGIFVRQFFELLKKSIGECYAKYKSTKEVMIDILQNNISNLRKYGEKMIIPCDKVVHHIKALADHILGESRAQF